MRVSCLVIKKRLCDGRLRREKNKQAIEEYEEYERKGEEEKDQHKLSCEFTLTLMDY